MHPNLATHLHGEECREVIAQLYKCHAENPYRKFIGACNEFKRALNSCLQKEYEIKQKKNFQASIDRKERYRRIMQDEDSK